MRVITLTTDFGTVDGYVGEMKGVLASEAPGVALIDLSHDIEPQNVDGARLLIDRCWRRFPPGTVHLVVVDPGVGSERGALAVRCHQQFFVGPDNGVLSSILGEAEAEVVLLPTPADASATFHGRDVFAPAAARLVQGAELSSLGRPFSGPLIHTDPEPLPLPNGSTLGEVMHADRYGNAITNIKTAILPGATVEVAGRLLPLFRTYAEAQPGQPLALVGSGGRLEIAVRNGHATGTLGLARGARVVLNPRG